MAFASNDDKFDWSIDGREQRLAELWAEGHSAGQIADMFPHPVTRSSVLGKVHRMKLPPRSEETKRQNLRASREAVERRRALEVKPQSSYQKRSSNAAARHAVERSVTPLESKPLPTPTLVEVKNAPKILADIGRRECRWGLDDPGPGRMDEMLMCAAPTGEGENYCPGHRRVAVNKVVAVPRRLMVPAQLRSSRRYN